MTNRKLVLIEKQERTENPSFALLTLSWEEYDLCH